jgi:hypothetical protein
MFCSRGSLVISRGLTPASAKMGLQLMAGPGSRDAMAGSGNHGLEITLAPDSPHAGSHALAHGNMNVTSTRSGK